MRSGGTQTMTFMSHGKESGRYSTQIYYGIDSIREQEYVKISSVVNLIDECLYRFYGKS